MKTRGGLVEDFLTFEEENNLFATDYWAYLRLEIYRAIEGDVFGTGYSPVYLRQSVDFSSVWWLSPGMPMAQLVRGSGAERCF